MIIKALMEYISTCPYLYEFNKGINVDYLDNDSTTYSIEEVPCNPIVKRYINGDTKRQYDFILGRISIGKLSNLFMLLLTKNKLKKILNYVSDKANDKK